MKKILHIISQYPGKTGSGVYLNSLIEEGDKRGHIQGLIYASNGEGYKNPYIEEKNHYSVRFNSEELPFPIVGMSDQMPYKSTKYKDLKKEGFLLWKNQFKKTIRKALEDFDPDIVFTHHLWGVSSLVNEVSKDMASKALLVGFCHGTDIRQYKNLANWRNFVIEGCSQLDYIFALSEIQKDQINHLYNVDKEKIVVIGGGYNNKYFYPNDLYIDSLPYRPVKLIYAGKISSEKGILPAIDAVEKLSTVYNVDFNLAGTGDGLEYDYIKSYAKESKANVKFLGNLTQEQLGKKFRESDIFIMPSYYEGLSLVTLEAMACGLLVVSSDLSGLKSFLGDDINFSGIIEYVNMPRFFQNTLPRQEDLPKYVEELEEKLIIQVKRLENKKSIINQVKGKISSFSWEAIYRKIEENLQNQNKFI